MAVRIITARHIDPGTCIGLTTAIDRRHIGLTLGMERMVVIAHHRAGTGLMEGTVQVVAVMAMATAKHKSPGWRGKLTAK